jgi:hypothetical protein
MFLVEFALRLFRTWRPYGDSVSAKLLGIDKMIGTRNETIFPNFPISSNTQNREGIRKSGCIPFKLGRPSYLLMGRMKPKNVNEARFRLPIDSVVVVTFPKFVVMAQLASSMVPAFCSRNVSWVMLP